MADIPTGINGLVMAAGLFVGIHLLVSGTALRGVLIGAIGEIPYQGAFSLLSIIGLAWLIFAYSNTSPEILWSLPVALDPLIGVIILIGFIFLVAGLTVKNPTLMGGEGALAQENAATGFLRITRHPMMWGFTLWSAAHLLKNGDIRSIIFFGTFLVVALIGPSQIDKRRAATQGDNWGKFALVTSNVPFAAIVQGRNSLKVGELGLWRIALGVALFAAAFHFHPQITGVSLY